MMQRSLRVWAKCCVLTLLLAGTAAAGWAADANSGDKPALPCPIPADLWVLGGQSNMQGVGRAFDDYENPKIMVFGLDDRWEVAREPLHRLFLAKAPVYEAFWFKFNRANFPSDAAACQAFEAQRAQEKIAPSQGVGPGLFFAREILAATGRPVGLIPCANGGTSMNDWNPALKDQGENSLYGMMLSRARKSAGGQLKGVLWYQGESDAGTTSSGLAYEGKMLNFVDCLRRDLGQPELPIIYVQLSKVLQPENPAGAAGWTLVREAQRRLMRQRKNLYMVTALDLAHSDMVHLGTEGQRVLGHRLAEVALSEIYKKPGHGHPIDLESVRLGAQTIGRTTETLIHLHFKGVSGRLQVREGATEFQLEPVGKAISYPPSVIAVEADPQDPAGLKLVVFPPLAEPMKLSYAVGLHPAVGTVDERGMGLPAFGPIVVKP